jgi:eukaryotic-like serine/threonine-protein kinase
MAEEIIGGYKLLNVMANYHNCQIWEVVEVAGHRHFCMKLLLPEKASDAEQRRLLIHEGTVGKLFSHPNILKVILVGKDAKNPFVVTELFPVVSLKHRIQRKQYDFIKQHAQNIFVQAAKAMGYINAKGWVHRDIKPDNILASNGGDVRISDFALAQKIQKASFFSSWFKRKGLTQGTRSYMSPEQIRGEDLDGRADIYTFAASMYEIVAYRPPFRAGSNQELLNKQVSEKPVSPQTHNPDLTDEFSELVLQMLAKKREQRPADFNQVLMRLQKLRVYKSASKAESN